MDRRAQANFRIPKNTIKIKFMQGDNLYQVIIKYLTFRFEIFSLHTFFDKLDLTSTICPAFSGRRTVQV